MGKPRNYNLSDEAIKYIDEYSKKKHINKTQTVELIISEHKEMYENLIDSLSKTLIEKFDEKYKNAFTRIRLASNNADKNSQIIIEILNAICVNQNIEDSLPTSDFTSPVISGAQETVKKRIAAYRIAKLNKDSKKRK